MSSEILGEFLWPKEIQAHGQQCGDDRGGGDGRELGGDKWCGEE